MSSSWISNKVVPKSRPVCPSNVAIGVEPFDKTHQRLLQYSVQNKQTIFHNKQKITQLYIRTEQNVLIKEPMHVFGNI